MRSASPGILALAVVTLFLTRPTSAQVSINVTSYPAFGTSGHLVGSVSGLPSAPLGFGMMVFLYVDGLGWFPKPTLAMPVSSLTPAGPSTGLFSVAVTTGGLDAYATIYVVHVVPSGATLPTGNMGAKYESEPVVSQSLAQVTIDRFGPTISFAGLTWAIKVAPDPVDPGQNTFSASNVCVDALGRLHLQVKQNLVTGIWESAEVVLLDPIGYGEFVIVTETDFAAGPNNVTAGFFTFDSFADDGVKPNGTILDRTREIDFEEVAPGLTLGQAQFVRQSSSLAGHLFAYSNPSLSSNPYLTRVLRWEPHQIEWITAHGRFSPASIPTSSVVSTAIFAHAPAASPPTYVPTPGRARFRLNAWLHLGSSAPSTGQPVDVIVSDFRYSPNIGIFRGGCGINPIGSLSLLSGSNSVAGPGLTLGVDNPTGSQSSGAAYLFAGFPDPAFPCGTAITGLGMAGPTGELLLDLSTAPPVSIGGPVPWPPAPASFAFGPLPAALVGSTFHLQGLIASPGVVPFGLTDALEITIQP